MIPAVLVDALLSSFGSMMEGNVFTIGRAPDGWPAALAPGAAATVIGGTRFGPLRSLVVSYPRAVNAESAYGAVLTRAGFRRAERAPDEGNEGFAMRTPDEPRGIIYCGDSARSIVIRPIDSTSAVRRVQLTMSGGDVRPSLCALRDSARVLREPRFFDRLDLRVPPLRPPVGLVVRSSGGGSSNSSFNVSARSDTALSATQLITHYGRELGRGGWALVGGPMTSGGSAMQTLRARDPKGAEWNGALTIFTVGDERQLQITMSKTGGF